MKLALLLSLFLLGICPASAKYWTDVKGRILEGEMTRISGGDPVVLLGNIETKLPLASLCEEDQKFVADWKKLHVTDGSNSSVRLDGKPMEAGGKINLVEKPYPAKTLKSMAAANHPEETGFKLAIAVPENFDPFKSQRIFVVSTGVNNEGERVSGNIGKFGMYSKLCVENGWVCLAMDSNTGYPSTFATIEDALGFLTKQWPKFLTNEYSVGGFSGGSKACYANVAWLLRNRFKVSGAFMGGCNQDFSKLYRDQLGTTIEGYRKLRAFVSTGKSDTIASPALAEDVVKSLGVNGIDNVRNELHEGGHSFYQPHFVAALEWFAAVDAKK